eukprot:scaffold2901_cov99-Isochrysis_galbana.AAC.2
MAPAATRAAPSWRRPCGPARRALARDPRTLAAECCRSALSARPSAPPYAPAPPPQGSCAGCGSRRRSPRCAWPRRRAGRAPPSRPGRRLPARHPLLCHSP